MEKCDYVMVKERIIVPDAVAVKEQIIVPVEVLHRADAGVSPRPFVADLESCPGRTYLGRLLQL